MKSLTGFSSLWMEGNLKEIATFLEGNFAEKKEIGRKPYVRKVEALDSYLLNISRRASSRFDLLQTSLLTTKQRGGK